MGLFHRLIHPFVHRTVLMTSSAGEARLCYRRRPLRGVIAITIKPEGSEHWFGPFAATPELVAEMVEATTPAALRLWCLALEALHDHGVPGILGGHHRLNG